MSCSETLWFVPVLVDLCMDGNVNMYGDTSNARRAPAAFGRLDDMDDMDYSSR